MAAAAATRFATRWPGMTKAPGDYMGRAAACFTRWKHATRWSATAQPRLHPRPRPEPSAAAGLLGGSTHACVPFAGGHQLAGASWWCARLAAAPALGDPNNARSTPAPQLAAPAAVGPGQRAARCSGPRRLLVLPCQRTRSCCNRLRPCAHLPATQLGPPAPALTAACTHGPVARLALCALPAGPQPSNELTGWGEAAADEGTKM